MKQQNETRRAFLSKACASIAGATVLAPLTSLGTIEAPLQSELETAIVDYGTPDKPRALIFRGDRLLIAEGQTARPCTLRESVEWVTDQESSEDYDGFFSHRPSWHRWLGMIASRV